MFPPEENPDDVDLRMEDNFLLYDTPATMKVMEAPNMSMGMGRPSILMNYRAVPSTITSGVLELQETPENIDDNGEGEENEDGEGVGEDEQEGYEEEEEELPDIPYTPMHTHRARPLPI